MFNDWHLAIRVDLWDKPVWLHLQMDVNLLCGDVLGSCNQTYALEGYDNHYINLQENNNCRAESEANNYAVWG